MADGGGALYFGPTKTFLAELEDEDTFDGTQPYWLCRYLDGYPHFTCGTVDLAVSDLQLLLAREGQQLPHSERRCPACDLPCRGPQPIECDGVPGMALAFLKHKYGAPLWGRVCARCGRVWLSLAPEDTEARTELAKRFPDSGPCPRCGQGRVRVTRLDVPHSGFAGLYEPAPAEPEGEGNPYRQSTRVAGLLVAVCDRCGEAATRIAEK
jgi:hypothetical protein